jgi:ribonuclease HII
VKQTWVIGIDEVGRGPIAGPVAICACAIKLSNYSKIKKGNLNDSKKMSVNNRNIWYRKSAEMKASGFIKYSVVYKSNVFIDRKGISVAIKECIANALKNLKLQPKDCKVLLDGSLKAPIEYKNQKTIIKGDSKEKIISFASVIAKVSRDKKMEIFAKKYPKYNWRKNKGYGTGEHYKAIEAYGLTPLHRRTFLTKR